MIGLGFKPLPLEVRLARDASFVGGLEAPEQDWPPGAQVELRFPATGSTVVWPATIAGRFARWNVTAEQVNAVLADRPRLARLFYRSTDTSPLLWAQGQVVTP